MTAARTRKVSLAGRSRDRLAPGCEDATPERLARAERGAASVDGQGVRRLADPFDLLRTRNLLDREDPERNALLWEAGERYRGHWHRGRLDGLSGFDFTRDSVDGTGGAGATTPTEAAMRHRETLHRAREAVGSRLLPYLTGIVIESRTAAALRPLVTDTGHPRTAEALIVERLREALHRLCDHWGMQPARTRRIGVWRAELSRQTEDV